MTAPSAISEPRSTIHSEFADLIEELTARLQTGEPIDVDAVIREHPEHETQIRELLPALAMMANLSSSRPACDSPPLDPAQLGELGDFQLIREVGRGGMGVVYEAEQLSLNRRVALKVLPFAATMDPRHLQRFQNEARAAACLHHPHIVPVHGVGCERGVHYYAMQLIEGRSLAQVIAEIKQEEELNCRGTENTEQRETTVPLSSLCSLCLCGKKSSYYRHIAELVAQAADALEYAHTMGVVHRDIKPGNLMLDNVGHLWVTDFGVAKLNSTDAAMTMTGDVIGTQRYMSPEQAMAKHGLVDHRTDVYSLGATLYELLTLRQAVDGTDKQEILQRIAFEEPVALRKVDKSIPAELETITLKALAKEPGERYATAAELADDLRRWLGDQAIKAKPPGMAQRVSKWGRRHFGAVAATATAMFLVAIAAVTSTVLVFQEKQRTQQAHQNTNAAYSRARFALDEMSSQVIDEWLAKQPALSEEQKKFLERCLSHYEWLADQNDAGAETRTGVAAAYLRVGDIRAKLGQTADAEAAYARAIRCYQQLADEFPAEGVYSKALAKSHRARGRSLQQFERNAEAEAAYKQALAIQEKSLSGKFDDLDNRYELAETLLVYGDFLMGFPRKEEAERNFRRGIELLQELGKRNVAHRHKSAQLHIHLGRHLYWSFSASRCIAEAEQHHRRGIEILEGLLQSAGSRYETAAYRNDLADGLTELAHTLGRGRGLDRPEEAVDADRRAVAIQEGLVNDFPAMPEYRLKLAASLRGLGNHLGLDLRHYSDAEPIYRRSIEELEKLAREFPNELRYQQELFTSVIFLGRLYFEAEKLADGERTFQYGVAISERTLSEFPGDSGLLAGLSSCHVELGHRLSQLGQDVKAETALRRAIEYQHTNAQAHNQLGVLFHARGQYVPAEMCFRRAIEIDAGILTFHDNLGLQLLKQKRFDEALASFQSADDLLKQGPDPAGPPPRWKRDARRLVKLRDRLPAMLSGELKPADSGEMITLAQMCQAKNLNRLAAQHYASAIASEPKLGAGPDSYRIPASYVSALAGCGQAPDSDTLSDGERSQLRRQALKWLTTHLGERAELGRKPMRERATIRYLMKCLQTDPDLAGVRDPAALAKLPDEERAAWQKYWADVAVLQKRCEATLEMEPSPSEP